MKKGKTTMLGPPIPAKKCKKCNGYIILEAYDEHVINCNGRTKRYNKKRKFDALFVARRGGLPQ